MGQLVQFEKELLTNPTNSQKLDIHGYLPTSEQIELSEAIRQSSAAGGSGGSSANNTPEPRSAGSNIGSATVEKGAQPFLLKMPKPRKQKQKKEVAPQENDSANQQSDSGDVAASSKSTEAASCNIPAQLKSLNEAMTCAPFPNQQMSAPSHTNNPSLSTPPSATSNSVVKDIVRKFEKSD